MEKTIKVLAMLLLVLFSACAAGSKTVAGGDDKKTATTTAKAKAEDLSAYRPKFTPVADASGTSAGTAKATILPTNHVNDQVAVLMDTIASANKKIKYALVGCLLVLVGYKSVYFKKLSEVQAAAASGKFDAAAYARDRENRCEKSRRFPAAGIFPQ